MSDSLKKLVKLIEDKRVLATSDAGIDPANRNTKLGHIKRVKEDLKDLFLEYRKEVQNRAVFMLCSGSQLDKFTEIAQKDFECFSVSAEDFYEVITSKIDKRLYENTNASRVLFEFINAGFEDLAMDIGIIGYQPVIFESKFKKVLKNKDDVVNMAIQAFNEKTGSESVGLYIIDKIAKDAVNKKVDTKFFPIIVHSKDEQLIEEFNKTFTKYFNKVFTLAIGKASKDFQGRSFINIKTVNEEGVEKALLKIREIIK